MNGLCDLLDSIYTYFSMWSSKSETMYICRGLIKFLLTFSYALTYKNHFIIKIILGNMHIKLWGKCEKKQSFGSMYVWFNLEVVFTEINKIFLYALDSLLVCERIVMQQEIFATL